MFNCRHWLEPKKKQPKLFREYRPLELHTPHRYVTFVTEITYQEIDFWFWRKNDSSRVLFPKHEMVETERVGAPKKRKYNN